MSYSYYPSSGTYGNITLSTDPNYSVNAVGTNANWTVSSDWSDISVATQPSSGKLCLTGDNADIEINGQSLKQTLEAINSRLGILTPNPELEKEFEELRELAERYKELEKKFLGQKKVFDILKKQDQ